MALTPKQQLFVNEYLIDLNGTQAAIRAGYSEKRAGVQAHELLKDEEVATAVKAAMADRAARLGVTQDWVVARLVDNVDQAMRAVPVLDRDGEPIGDYTYQGSVANKALEILGKHVGIDRPVEVNVTSQVTHTHVEGYTLADILAASRSIPGLDDGAGEQLPAAGDVLAESDEGVDPTSDLPV